MDLNARVAEHFRQSAELKLQSAAALAPDIGAAAAAMAQALGAGGKLLACGNGGSAADAQHFAAELLNRFEIERAPLAAVALTTDGSTLTSIANDYDYRLVFAKQVQALARRGDMLLAISTSGNSPNVVAAIAAAQAAGARVVALTGRDGGAMRRALGAGDLSINVPHANTARIQEVHILVIHCLCDAIDRLMFAGETR
jgi:D-sedoheptulose 7-phosphate isomerase